MKHVWVVITLAGPRAGAAALDVGTRPKALPPGGRTVSNGEIEHHLAALSGEHSEDAAPAVAWLVAHPEQARPPLAELVRAAADDQATRCAMEILARIGRGDDVTPLAAVLALGRGSLSWTAAQALAAHPAAAARDALLAALAAPAEDVVSAAVVALGQRRDEVARAALRNCSITRQRVSASASCTRLIRLASGTARRR